MKFILTTTSPNIDSQVDPRFGRAEYFLLVDPDTLEWQAFPNPGKTDSGGAGTHAVQFVTDQNCEAVISGNFGPNAYKALKAAGIPMYLIGSCRTPHDVIERYKSGDLKLFDAPAGPKRRRR